MAEEKKEGEEGGDSKGKSKKTLFIIIGAVVLLIVIGVGAFLALSGSKKSADGEEGDDTEEVATEGEGGAEGEGVELPGAILPLETFIVNLQVKGSFLKTTIQLEFAEPELPHTIESDVPKIRHAIIRILSAKTAADILSEEGKEKTREEIKIAVNETLGSEDVVQIYYTEFIVQ